MYLLYSDDNLKTEKIDKWRLMLSYKIEYSGWRGVDLYRVF